MTEQENTRQYVACGSSQCLMTFHALQDEHGPGWWTRRASPLLSPLRTLHVDRDTHSYCVGWGGLHVCVCVWAPSVCQCWGQVSLEIPLHLMPELPPLFSSSSFYRSLSLPFMCCRACSSSMSPLGLIDPRAKQTRTLGQTCGPYDHTWLHS